MPARLKIAVLASGNVPSRRAHSINTVQHALAFRELGHEVVLFAPLRYRERQIMRVYGGPQECYGSEVVDIPFRLFLDPTPFFLREAPAIGPFVKLLEKVLVRWDMLPGDPEAEIARAVLQEGFDVAYCRTYRGARYLVEEGLPVIVETHTTRLEHPSLKRLFETSASNSFRVLSTISPRLKDAYVQAGVPREKVLVQEDAVNLDWFKMYRSRDELRDQLALPKDRWLVVYAGGLWPGKGIPDLLDVASKLKVDPDVELVLVGGPSKRREVIRAEAAKRELSNLRLVGEVAPQYVPRYLRAADTLIMLYSTREQNRVMDLETTSPMKLFEYLASGRPAVVTEIPTIRKVVSEEEVLFARIDDPSSAARAVLEAKRDPDLRRALSRRARQKAAKHTYKSRCQRLLEAAL